VGAAADPNDATVTGTVTTWEVNPPLPAGLTLDAITGALQGLPAVEAAAADYVVTASNSAGSTEATVNLLVGPALPAFVLSLPLGFTIDTVASGLAIPSKFAVASDRRIFFTELKTGNVRVIDATGALLPTPFATVTVQGAGSHQGLIGLALAPDFESTGHLYVLYCAPADGMHATDHMRLERFTDVADVGTNQTAVLDNLPIATINNGTDLVFDLTGALFVSLGDANVDTNAQDPLVLPGKILRIPAATLAAPPVDTSDEAALTHCIGLRNTYGLAVHPVTGGLFGVDNGPAADDELNYLVAGKNFGWGTMNVPGGTAGVRLRVWQTEIVPTSLAWHFGGTWGAEYEDDLFLGSYQDEEVLRYEMSGSAKTDIDNDVNHPIFLKFATAMNDNKPLDLVVDADGNLLVGTFSAIYRIRRL
jgi:glucose/arabinose dehydrogenase